MSENTTPLPEEKKPEENSLLLPPLLSAPLDVNSETKSVETKTVETKPVENQQVEINPETTKDNVSTPEKVEVAIVEEKPAENQSPESKKDSPNVEEKTITEPTAVATPVKIDIESIAKEGLDVLIEKYLDDGVIDNDELVDLVKCTMEIVEKKKEIEGPEKKRVALLILRKFIEDKVKDYDNLEKLFDKAIDLAVKVSKEGLENIKLSSETIGDAKSAFNLIYASTMSKINEKYPQTDDIVNNLFDIALYVMQLLEGQTSLSETEKKVLLKKIMQKVIISLESKLGEENKNFLLSQIEPTINLVQIGIKAQNGQLEINPAEVVGFLTCIMAWFRKCCKRSSPPK